MVGDNLLSHRVAPAVPSASWCLTSVFGMGTGGSTRLRSPTKSYRRGKPTERMHMEWGRSCVDMNKRLR